MKSHEILGIEVSYGDRAALENQFRNEQAGCIYAAIHVGSFSHLLNGNFPTNFASKRVVFYPDGISMVLVLRKRGCKGVSRLPTTDVGWDFLYSLSKSSKLGIIGGESSVNRKVAEIFRGEGFDVIWSLNGFEEKMELLTTPHEMPDLIFVGLGMPLELEFALKISHHFPSSKIVTCGGWFNFIASEENRAPKWIQKIGFEWTWRLGQDPKRLFKRYFFGTYYFLKLLSK
jgi:N-acetylglucosaminyldiphosphoundecaprenol N-acetyl-beta-D-mannosaminyltransferase